jgi:hypothetical protein
MRQFYLTASFNVLPALNAGVLLNNVISVLSQLIEKPGKKTDKIGFNSKT